jgi:hypothetical protein
LGRPITGELTSSTRSGLAFIAVVRAHLRLARIDLHPAAERCALRAASYEIGTLAAFRFCERLAGFVS